LSPAGLVAQINNGRKVAAYRARELSEAHKAVTTGLVTSFQANGRPLRSKAEFLAQIFLAESLDSIPGVTPSEYTISYPELDYPDRADDVSLTFYGFGTLKTRDFDLRLKDDLYTVSVKGLSSYYYRLREAVLYHNEKKFLTLRSELLNYFIYAMTKEVSLAYAETDVITPTCRFSTSPILRSDAGATTCIPSP
jgi:hypothetical protein